MDSMFLGANAFNQNISNWMVVNLDPKLGMRDMFKNSGYKHTQPNIELAKERLKDLKNVETLGQQATLKNSEYFGNNLGAETVFAEQGLRDKIGENFGGKSKKTTRKRKYKSKKKNISRKRKQSKRKI